jgi:hypothetical protein
MVTDFSEWLRAFSKIQGEMETTISPDKAGIDVRHNRIHVGFVSRKEMAEATTIHLPVCRMINEYVDLLDIWEGRNKVVYQ